MSIRTGPVLAGVDGSPAATRAVRWAADEATYRQTSLRLVTAFGWPDESVAGRHHPGKHYRDLLRVRAEADLDAAAAVVRDAVPDLLVEQQLIVGHPIAVLLAQAHSAQLVVVGAGTSGRFADLLTGSVAVAMATHAPCPTVVVRGPAEPDLTGRPVIVGIDGSPASEAALAFAFEAAAVRGVALEAVHTWWVPAFDLSVEEVLYGEETPVYYQQVLGERLAGWAEKYPEVRVDRIVVEDKPARRLLARAEAAQLVVVGSRGRGPLAAVTLGSVGNTLVHRAPCPVAIVRPDREEP